MVRRTRKRGRKGKRRTKRKSGGEEGERRSEAEELVKNDETGEWETVQERNKRWADMRVDYEIDQGLRAGRKKEREKYDPDGYNEYREEFLHELSGDTVLEGGKRKRRRKTKRRRRKRKSRRRKRKSRRRKTKRRRRK